MVNAQNDAARRAGSVRIAAAEGVARDGQGLLGWQRVLWPLGRGSSAGAYGLEARVRWNFTSRLCNAELVSVFTGIVGEVPVMKQCKVADFQCAVYFFMRTIGGVSTSARRPLPAKIWRAKNCQRWRGGPGWPSAPFAPRPGSRGGREAEMALGAPTV